MKDKTKKQLIEELEEARARIAELQVSEEERKRAEEALAYERNLLHALMDNIPDTIYFKDTASGFTRINRAQAQVLGVKDSQEAIGKTDFDFFDAELAQHAYADEQEIIKTGQPLIGKVERAVKPDGEVRWFSATKAGRIPGRGSAKGNGTQATDHCI